ncbi:hypothetical protein C8T65DRAFT_737048 [Cerioporus squamosus]|nr:hypothetical protein C8T65DRAFT_737048 [Cerioporus squamosus]
MSDDNTSSSSPIARVPVDVFHKILVAVGDDPSTHSACSLVARGWYDVAVPFLFSTVVFNGGRLRPLALLLDFLATHPHLTRFMKKLKIRGNLDMGCGPEEREEQEKALTVDLNQLNVSLSKLPVLESLFLREVSISPPPPGQPITGIPLRKICISRLLFSAEAHGLGRMATECMLLAAYSPHTLMVCDMAHSRIHTLDVDRDVPRRFIPLRPMRIHTVLLDWRAVQSTHQWLEAILAPDALRQFSTTCSLPAGLANIIALHSLLLSAGRCLESLKISTTAYGMHVGPLLSHMGNIGEAISACTSLRSFNIEFHNLFHPEHVDQPTPIALFKPLLSSAPATLRHIIVDLPDFEMPSLAICDLACLDHPWFRKQCPVLETLHFRFSYDKHALPSVESAIVTVLPGLQSTGILRVTLVPARSRPSL